MLRCSKPFLLICSKSTDWIFCSKSLARFLTCYLTFLSSVNISLDVGVLLEHFDEVEMVVELHLDFHVQVLEPGVEENEGLQVLPPLLVVFLQLFADMFNELGTLGLVLSELGQLNHLEGRREVLVVARGGVESVLVVGFGDVVFAF